MMVAFEQKGISPVRALLSVYDKSGLDVLASGLADLGFELISTGGTLAYLTSLGLNVLAVSEVTGFPEILDGRVKTLHPQIHGGILARKESREHMEALTRHGITAIDVVAGNLYPFEATVARSESTLAEALENIDIGGPAMIRAAAKNYPNVVILTNPADYAMALDELRVGSVTDKTRRSFAASAFQHVSTYDAIIAEYLHDGQPAFPDELTIPGRKVMDLRYGENPHQHAAAYRRPSGSAPESGVLDARKLQGKDLSYNNILDSDAAFQVARSLDGTACVIVKHAIPCGAAIRPTVLEAFNSALAGDPVSAFGGIVAVNQSIDANTATAIAETFFEVVLAPGFSDEALHILGARKNLRVLELAADAWTVSPSQSVRSIAGGLLVQDADRQVDDSSKWTVVTQTKPTAQQALQMRFAWQVCRFVRSNAIVLANDFSIAGVGPGQPNRVDSVRIAIDRAGERTAGSVLASDAFFPFADGVQAAIDAGVSAVVQPGGSIRDDEVIAACNEAGVSMMFTGIRHFAH